MREHRVITFLLLIACLILCTCWSITQGAAAFSWQDFSSLFLPAHNHSLSLNIFIEIRAPRILLALFAGAILAVAGVVMQALFRNPLAEPGLMGLSAGAALGAVLAIVLLGANLFTVVSSAFLGGLLATLCAYYIGKRFTGMGGLLLAGIAINAIAFSFIGLLSYIANDSQLRDLSFWGMGSLSTASWSLLVFIIPWTSFWIWLLRRQWRALNALLLGEREVLYLGFSVTALRRRLILCITLLVGPLIAVTGGIGFIGLIVPHIMRRQLGANHRYLIPASALGGAILLLFADTLARTIILPAELPVGLLTSLLGGPFFLYLLLRGKAV